MEFNFTGDDFRKLIKDSENEIIKRTSSGIHENDNFKRLLALLKTYQKKNPFVGFLAILVPKIEIENLNDTIADKTEIQLSSTIAATNNHIIINKDFDIISSERRVFDDGNHVRRIYTEISSDFCVFHISEQGIHYFVDGDDLGDAIFYSPADQDRFNELKGIDQIEEVFDEYRVHLRKRNTYSKFFVPNSGKRIMHEILSSSGDSDVTIEDFLEENKQLLNNKPEDIFREDLRIFLIDKLKGSFLGKEYILENFKRLDIFIRDDDFGELYLIEVKWVGLSIHPLGHRAQTKFEKKDINPAGILQSIDYIKELYENKTKIKIGFLAVFDARADEHATDTGSGYVHTKTTDSTFDYYSKFKKIPDFLVMNLRPR